VAFVHWLIESDGELQDMKSPFLPLNTWCICAVLFVTLFISLKLGTALGIDWFPAEICEMELKHLTKINYKSSLAFRVLKSEDTYIFLPGKMYLL